MPDFQKSVMVALMPTTTEWSHIKLPHLTLVYAGEMPDLKPTVFNELAKEASSIAMENAPMTLQVKGLGIFGSTDKVDVLRLKATLALQSMRRALEPWNASEHAFNPHVTIGPAGQFKTTIPKSITFNQIIVGWGDEILTFWLKGAA